MAELEPPELARLVDFAERSRAGDWSLRSALVRYAEGQPVRVSQVLELVRRIEAALHLHAKLLATGGAHLWSALERSEPPATEPEATVVGVLRAAAGLDRLAELMATWATDRTGATPDAEVDIVVQEVTQWLDDLGVAREERQGPPRRRG